MEPDLSFFDIEKVKQNKKFLIDTESLRTIVRYCEEAQRYHAVVGLIGEAGYGKSVAFDYYLQQNNFEKVYRITVEKSMTAKRCYLDLLQQVQVNDIELTQSDLNRAIRAIAQTLNASHSNLIIFDEAGKFSPNKLLFLHELRDATRYSTGFVLAGPSYFKRNLDTWKTDKVDGIPELYRRIQTWITIKAPSLLEKETFCKEWGILSKPFIKELVSKAENFGELENELNTCRIFIDKMTSDSTDKI